MFRESDLVIAPSDPARPDRRYYETPDGIRISVDLQAVDTTAGRWRLTARQKSNLDIAQPIQEMSQFMTHRADADLPEFVAGGDGGQPQAGAWIVNSTRLQGFDGQTWRDHGPLPDGFEEASAGVQRRQADLLIAVDQVARALVCRLLRETDQQCANQALARALSIPTNPQN